MNDEMTIRPARLPSELCAIAAAWTESMPASFEMSAARLDGYLTRDPNFDPDGCIGAFTPGGELAGFVIAKRWRIPNHDMAQDDATQWVRDGTGGIGMICVRPPFQRKGIGKRLVTAAEAFFKKNDVRVISIGREPGRHLLPGVPQPLEDTLEFFDKLGYSSGFTTAIDIKGNISGIEAIPDTNTKLRDKIATNRANGYDVISYDPSMRDSLLDFMRVTFPGKWYWTVLSHVDAPDAPRDELQVLVRKHGNKRQVLGFAHTSTQAAIGLGPATLVQSRGSTEFGGLGPIGIANDIRGSQGLGAMLLHHALVNLHRKGVNVVLIDWTSQGLLDRYYGLAGFTLYMTYISVKKELPEA
ncbi:MAG: GNAT family N-acetyltransferase [Candidatus Lokiarchaeota archaeon]|nr:GNAT family N-acetyltransferase [Candidatus Lokiarchaeota archaeon]